MMRNTSAVTASPRAMKRSTSGMQRALHSSRYTGSMTGFQSRKGSRMLSESRMGRSGMNRKAIRVLDEDGNDVTPRPLFEPETKDPHAKPQKLFFDDFHSRWDTSKSSSYFMMRSSGSCMWSSSLPSLSAKHGDVGYFKSDTSQAHGIHTHFDKILRRSGAKCARFLALLSDSSRKSSTGAQQVADEFTPDEVLNVYLSETDTITLLDMPSMCMSEEAENAQAVKESNSIYIELCKNRLGNDKYVERAMQTFVGAEKHKKVQTDKILMNDEGTQATIWDIHDSFQPDVPKVEKAANRSVELEQGPKRTNSSSSISTVGTTSSGSSLFAFKMQRGDVLDEPELQQIFKSPMFQSNLVIMERCLVANIFQPRLASYRKLPEIKVPPVAMEPEPEDTEDEKEREDEDEGEDVDEVAEQVTKVPVKETVVKKEEQVKVEEKKEEKEEGEKVEEEQPVEEEEEEEEKPDPTLELLWTFSCELTKGWNITCMAWNKQNTDLLAVGYGDFKPGKEGLICCWSIKNLSWPERLYRCHSAITSLNFSSTKPDKLAVGMYDGTVAIFSVRHRDSHTFLTSSIDCKKRHVHPVWHITWAKQEMGLSEEDTVESIVSISEDGRVLKWLLCSHGLDSLDMLELRRIQDGIKKTEGNKTRKEGILVSTATPGLCLDFQPKDPTIYLAGTSEGVVHKCSVSNHHHYLAIYQKHLCPVNRVEWSPFSNDVFLSCSSDWTIQLWKEDCLTPAIAFTSIQSPVLSVRWSPLWPSVFAAVKSEQLEIWDLNASLMDPVIVEPAAKGVRMTFMLFARNSDCILVGSSVGEVHFYRINNLSVSLAKKVPSLEELVHFPSIN
ncbi:dynein axonemal intermediate chain 4 isoform X1 [Stigmatopora argus]